MGLAGCLALPWKCLVVVALRLLFLVPAGVPARSGDSYLKDNITVRQGDSAVVCVCVLCVRGFRTWEGHSKTLILAWFSHSFTTFDVCFGSLSCWNTQTAPKTNRSRLMVDAVFLIVNISPNITVNEGSNVSLMCLAIGRPEPSIVWKYRSARGRRVVNEGEYVEMTAITKEQSGPYECVSSNEISPPDVRTVQVTVNYPPVISRARSTGTPVGHRGVLQCEASAVPLADFQWYKEDRPLVNGLNGVKIENKGKQSMLIFFNVSEEDYGNYTCVAMNMLGITNASIILYGVIDISLSLLMLILLLCMPSDCLQPVS
uniref:Opioid binding protein/cell adhesion molecule-like n=1 Tax=Astyanax mexicanus TaxID=7994 RepID=A0A3B1IXW9_ASTMX